MMGFIHSIPYCNERLSGTLSYPKSWLTCADNFWDFSLVSPQGDFGDGPIPVCCTPDFASCLGSDFFLCLGNSCDALYLGSFFCRDFSCDLAMNSFYALTADFGAFLDFFVSQVLETYASDQCFVFQFLDCFFPLLNRCCYVYPPFLCVVFLALFSSFPMFELLIPPLCPSI